MRPLEPRGSLQVLDTQYTSIAGPVVAFIDELRRHGDEHVLVLIPVVRTDRLRYRLLHNHLDIVLNHGAADPHRHGRGPGRYGVTASRRRNRPEPPLAGAKPTCTGLAAAATPTRSVATSSGSPTP